MKKNFLTDEQKISYKNYGAIVIKNVFEPWISTLQKGFDKVLANPGPHARENVKIKDKIITKLKDRIQDIIKQLVHLCKTE